MHLYLSPALLHDTDLFGAGNYRQGARNEDQCSGNTAYLQSFSLLACCSLAESTPVGCGQAVPHEYM